LKPVPNDYNRGTCECSDSVEVRPEHCRDFGYEDVARDAAANTGKHTQHDGGDRRKTKCERFQRTRYCEESQPCGVDDEHRRLESRGRRIREKYDYAGE
jgi:hypothetical protein